MTQALNCLVVHKGKNKIKNFKNKIALITKIDLIKEDNDFLLKEKIKILDEYQFKKIFPISIKKRTSIDNLIEEFDLNGLNVKLDVEKA